MSQFWGGGFPRNTSNGDYGRFLFTTNQTTSGQQPAYSTNGNRMIQQMHYPNCPNQHANSQSGMGSPGMQDYTVEYGEDAVRAALGGNMPDFQAQFQQEYGDGGGGDAMVMNNGKTKVAMIPVVLHDDSKSNQQESQPIGIAEERSGNEKLSANSGASEVISSNESSPIPHGTNQETEDTTPAPAVPQQDSINNAYASVRKSRSSIGQVKCGRHVRPSYVNPELPNPCRKNTIGFHGLPELPKLDQSVHSQTNLSQSASLHEPNELLASSYNKNSPPMVANIANSRYTYDQGVLPPPQRTRSLQPKKHVRPTYSFCGKCQKCKNLSSEPETSVLTFPAYSPGTRRGSGNHNLTSSSNLGQSAKNFRAIRFSSNHM